jgi:hypothetical protein
MRYIMSGIDNKYIAKLLKFYFKKISKMKFFYKISNHFILDFLILNQ